MDHFKIEFVKCLQKTQDKRIMLFCILLFVKLLPCCKGGPVFSTKLYPSTSLSNIGNTEGIAHSQLPNTMSVISVNKINISNNNNNIYNIKYSYNNSNQNNIMEKNKITRNGKVSTDATGNIVSRWRKQHRKRHSVWYDYNNYNENATLLEWSNPCGGMYHPVGKRIWKPNKREQLRIFNILKRSALSDYKKLLEDRQQEINITNIKIWWRHNYTYKFLPKLKFNSSVALKRWYRNMQTYVATFGYLRRIQLGWDHSKLQRESNVSRELKDLLISSRAMLCELEIAVNRTQPKWKQNEQFLTQYISRQQMNKRLKLRTKQQMEQRFKESFGADTIDLKFVKYYYYEYLKYMWKILRHYVKHNGRFRLREKVALNETQKYPIKLERNATRKRRYKNKQKMYHLPQKKIYYHKKNFQHMQHSPTSHHSQHLRYVQNSEHLQHLILHRSERRHIPHLCIYHHFQHRHKSDYLQPPQYFQDRQLFRVLSQRRNQQKQYLLYLKLCTDHL